MLPLRRERAGAEDFPRDVQELRLLPGDPRPGQLVRAISGEGSTAPLWTLGSRLDGVQLAAALGLS